MSECTFPALSDICAQLAGHTLPRWNELPDLELYMDQVLSLIARYLGSYPGFDEKGLTSSMVNNYVKLGVLPPPRHKRYTREHVARLLMLCLLKASLPIATIRALLDDALSAAPLDSFYDGFCTLFESAGAAVAAAHTAPGLPEDEAVFRAALRAQAEQALALKLCAARFPDGI